jgi:sugar/nucleoside kinase (ribokinase family)
MDSSPQSFIGFLGDLSGSCGENAEFLALKEAGHAMKYDIGLIGPLNVDLLINGQARLDMAELTRWAGPSNVTLCAAGSAGYIAQDLARFGLKTSLVSTLAEDPFGDAILRILNEAGLNTDCVDRQAGTLSGIGIYMLLFGSKKRPLTYRLPTHRPWPTPITEGQKEFLLGLHRHIHCAGYLHFPDMWNEQMAGLFRDAKARGLTTSLDPQFVLFPVSTPWLEPIREMLHHTDLLLLDEDEAHQITLESDLGKAAEMFHSLGAGMVFIKQGAKGSLLYHDGITHQLPAVPVPEEDIADSIGAGDAFDTGILYGFLQGLPPERCQEFATRAAASTLRGAGGTSSLASIEELMEGA